MKLTAVIMPFRLWHILLLVSLAIIFIMPMVPMGWVTRVYRNDPPKPLPVGTKIVHNWDGSIPRGATGVIVQEFGTSKQCPYEYVVQYDDWNPKGTYCEYSWRVKEKD